jgi:ketosteroid isomerase-like protein
VTQSITPDDFVRSYEAALASQQWAAVDPLMHDDVCVTFSTGAVHTGKPAVRRAFEHNFASIEDERYRITNIHWVLRSEDFAVYLFDFQWSGRINGRETRGSGRGTSVLARAGAEWKLLAEHLGSGS